MTKMTKTEQIFALTAPYNNPYQGKYHKALFVCSAGILRSATAANIGAELGMNTRSCGTESYALVPLSLNLITWADTIYFVNITNYSKAIINFSDYAEAVQQLETKSVIWDIEDQYEYMNAELVQQIQTYLLLN